MAQQAAFTHFYFAAFDYETTSGSRNNDFAFVKFGDTNENPSANDYRGKVKLFKLHENAITQESLGKQVEKTLLRDLVTRGMAHQCGDLDVRGWETYIVKISTYDKLLQIMSKLAEQKNFVSSAEYTTLVETKLYALENRIFTPRATMNTKPGDGNLNKLQLKNPK